MTYSFLYAYSSVQTADSSVVSGTTQRPIVQIGSVLSAIPVSINGSPSISGAVTLVGNPSISGRVDASIVGTVPVTQSGTVISSISGTVTVLPSFVHPSSFFSGVTSIVTGTASILVADAAPALQTNYITNMIVTNAATAGTFVDIVDNGNVIYSGYAAASGGGFSAAFPTALKQPTSVMALYVLSRAQASVIAAISGYTT